MTPTRTPLTITLTLLLLATSAHAQSGRSTFSGYVAFDGVAYVDKQPTATVEFFRPDDKTHPVATTHTDEHGHYDVTSPSLGECILRITAPGYAPYEIPIYLPSDFSGHLATLLKKADAAPASTQK